MALHWPSTQSVSFVLTSQEVPCVLVSQNSVGPMSSHEPVLPTLSPISGVQMCDQAAPGGVSSQHSWSLPGLPLLYRHSVYLFVHVSFCVGGRASHHGPLLYFNSLVIK